MLSHRGNLNLILIDDPLLLFAEGAVFSLMNTVNYLKAPFGKGAPRWGDVAKRQRGSRFRRGGCRPLATDEELSKSFDLVYNSHATALQEQFYLRLA